MSRLTIYNLETAGDDVINRLELAKKANGFLPNLIGVLANAPSALAMYQEVGKLNSKTSLTPQEREVIQITAAAFNQCSFCIAGHSKISQQVIGIPDVIIQSLRELTDFSKEDIKLNQLAKFTLAVLEQKGNVSDSVLEQFFSAGYNQQQAVEVVLGIALASLCNFTNNLAKTPINEELKPFA